MPVKAKDATIPAIGLGTWELRGEQCSRLVKEALEIGYRHIDTAAMYQNEESVGAGIMASGVKRDEIFVTTKVWIDDLGPETFQASAKDSLMRLGLDEVDLLLVHWPKRGMSMEDHIEPLVDAKNRGLTKHIGVSNFPTDLLRQAQEISGNSLVTNQCEYHPYLNQNRVLATCRALEMSFTSYCPIGRQASFDEAIIRTIAKSYGKTQAQIVLRWHVQQEGIIAIPRTSKSERLSENLAVFDFELAPEEMSEIHALTKKGDRICDYVFSPDWDETLI